MSYIFLKNTHCPHTTAKVLANDSLITDCIAKSSIKFGYVLKEWISIFWRDIWLEWLLQEEKSCYSFWEEP